MHLATVISIQLKKQWIDQDVQSTACLISKTYFQKRSKHQLTLCQLKDTLTAEKGAFSFYLKWNVTFSLWAPSITIFLQLSPSLFAPGSARYTGWLQHSWCEILQPHGKPALFESENHWGNFTWLSCTTQGSFTVKHTVTSHAKKFNFSPPTIKSF